MKLIVDHIALRTALQLCASVVDKRPTIPSLADVRLEAHGETLTLATTDLEVTAVYDIKAVVADSGSGCTAEAQALLEIAKVAPDALHLELHEKNMTLEITSGSARWVLPTLPLENYPTLPTMDEADELEFSPSEFLPMLRTVSYAIPSNDEQGMTVKGANVKLTKRAMEICAVNGFQMGLVTLPGKFRAEASIFMPAKLVRATEKLTVSADATTIHLSWNRSHVAVRLGAVTLMGRLEDARFPAYESYLPKERKSTARMETQYALDALRRVQPFAANKTHAIVASVSLDEIGLKSVASSSRGSSTDKIGLLAYSGEPLCVGVSAKHLADMFENVNTLAMEIDFGDGKTAIVGRPVDSSLPFSAIHLVMLIGLHKIEGAA